MVNNMHTNCRLLHQDDQLRGRSDHMPCCPPYSFVLETTKLFDRDLGGYSDPARRPPGLAFIPMATGQLQGGIVRTANT